MSETEIFAVSKNSHDLIGETKNSWRSAMYVWNYVSRKYFCLPLFPFLDDEMQMKIWNAYNHHSLPDHEVIVLLSTMDRATVKSCDLPWLIHAFEKFSTEHPDSSLGEQAEILKNASLSEDQLIAWNQTSIGEFCFSPIQNDDGEILEFHDLSNAFDLFQAFDEYKAGQ